MNFFHALYLTQSLKVNLEHFDLLILYTKEFEVYLKTILFQFLIHHLDNQG